MSNDVKHDNHRVMPIPQGGRAQNNLFQQRQKQRNGEGDEETIAATGNFDKSSFEAPQTHVPVHGIGVDVVGNAPVGANFYVVAEWSATRARVGDKVRVKAVLNKGIDGAVRVQVFQEVDNQQIWIESLNGFINKGIVSAVWVAKNKAHNYNRGNYFFTIIGGRANATSTNRLTIV